MLETCRGTWFSINWMKSASRWFHYTDTLSFSQPFYNRLYDLIQSNDSIYSRTVLNSCFEEFQRPPKKIWWLTFGPRTASFICLAYSTGWQYDDQITGWQRCVTKWSCPTLLFKICEKRIGKPPEKGIHQNSPTIRKPLSVPQVVYFLQVT
jgi:hypothetical protein